MPEQDPKTPQDPQLLTNSESTQIHHSAEFLVDWPVTDGDVGHLKESLQGSQYQQQLRQQLQFSRQDEEYRHLLQQMEIRNWD